MDTNEKLIDEIKAALKNSAAVVDVIYKRCPSAGDKIDLVHHLNWMVSQGAAKRDDVLRSYSLTSTVEDAPGPAEQPSVTVAEGNEAGAPSGRRHPLALQPAPTPQVTRLPQAPTAPTTQSNDDPTLSTIDAVLAHLRQRYPQTDSPAAMICRFPARTKGSIYGALTVLKKRGLIEGEYGGPYQAVLGSDNASVKVIETVLPDPQEDLNEQLREALVASCQPEGAVDPSPAQPGIVVGIKTVLVITLPEAGQQLELDASEAFIVRDYINANSARLRETA
ncbi:MAG: hypothetical protein JNM11_12570 [Chitinimonas sp.]|nr:hypothetical protein [Chitinimonas sp.]